MTNSDIIKAMSKRAAYGVLIDTKERYKNGDKRIATLTAVDVDAQTYNHKTKYSQAVGVPIFYNGEPTCTMFLRSPSTMTAEEREILEGYQKGVSVDAISQATEMVDWLLERKFDIEGLIPQGYAYEAPQGMYNY